MPRKKAPSGDTAGSAPAMRHVLVAVTGESPQVVTETLHVLLAKRRIPVSEVRVVTTTRGLARLHDLVLGHEGIWPRFLKDHGLRPADLRFDESTVCVLKDDEGRPLEDIRTDQDNELAADRIYEVVRDLALQPDVAIHASMAGGRKTMGVLLAYAMSLLGRPQDSLTHVLVSPDLERNRDFFYPLPSQPEGDAIDLAEVPFVRLGRLGETPPAGQTYVQQVRRAQQDIDTAVIQPELEIDLRMDAGTVRIGSRLVELSPMQFAHYAAFATMRKRCRSADPCPKCATTVEGLAEVDSDFREAAMAAHDAVFPEQHGNLANRARNASQGTVRSYITQINQRIEQALGGEAAARDYRIERAGRRRPDRYWLPLPADRIRFLKG